MVGVGSIEPHTPSLQQQQQVIGECGTVFLAICFGLRRNELSIGLNFKWRVEEMFQTFGVGASLLPISIKDVNSGEKEKVSSYSFLSLMIEVWKKEKG